MGVEDLKKLKEKMRTDQTTNVPADGGSFAGANDPARPQNRDVELQQSGGAASGQKSISEKTAVAEEKIAAAKAEDVENTREATTDKGNRHDLIVGGIANIPPTIQAERMKMGQHPITGEPWTPQEHREYHDNIEKDRIAIAKSVKESEDRMRKDVANPPLQPISHVPTAFLTQAQRDAMQKSQDAGDSPARQAQNRDMMHPDEVGRREGAQTMLENDDNDIDQELEDQELNADEDEDDDDDSDPEPDPDELEESLSKK